MSKKKSIKKVASILDSSLDGSGVHQVAKIANTSSSTVLDVLKDFPLWEYVRQKSKKARKKIRKVL